MNNPKPSDLKPSDLKPSDLKLGGPQSITEFEGLTIRGGVSSQQLDQVAIEEPLELRLITDAAPVVLAVLMRTPQQDEHLLVGWLVAEGMLPKPFSLRPDPENPNVWWLATPMWPSLVAQARLGVSSSACGVCGSGSIEQLAIKALPLPQTSPVSPAVLAQLPKQLVAYQQGFLTTGGLHGAALFRIGSQSLGSQSLKGQLECQFLHAAEDVGRHNAVDKVVGWAEQNQLLPLHQTALVVSSRAGFEIAQKAISAGIPIVVAVGAATSLAIETAKIFNLTLCAFAREGRLTVYSTPERLKLDQTQTKLDPD